MNRLLKKLRYLLEAGVILLLFGFFRLLPLDLASWLGGRIARSLGPWTRAHETARRNMERIWPEQEARIRRKNLRDMWDNLGRVIGEYPHLSRACMKKRISLSGREHLDAVKASGKGALFLSGHFANWEIIPLTAALHGLKLVVIYRPPNNPLVDRLIRRIRAPYNAQMYAKGREGAIQAIRTLKEKKILAMLIDQKMNDGSEVPFFGHPAMTALAPLRIAVAQEASLLVARVERLKGARFHVTLEPPLHLTRADDPKACMSLIHAVFERWITERPAQWFWVHRRWGKG